MPGKRGSHLAGRLGVSTTVSNPRGMVQPGQPGFDPDLFVTVFADASWCHRTQAGGWAVWIKHGAKGETVRLSGEMSAPSSNQAEYLALMKGVEYLQGRPQLTQDKIVILQSDCTGALSKMEPARAHFPQAKWVKLKHVKGHRGHQDARASVNTWCDLAAKEHMRKARDRVERARMARGKGKRP